MHIMHVCSRSRAKMVVTALLSNATRLDTLLVGTEKLKWHIGNYPLLNRPNEAHC